MIERDFVKQKKREFQVQEFISNTLKNVGHSYTELLRTPLGDKVIVHTSRPGLVVGRKGQNITKLTEILKTRFKLDNPQVEISEVENPNLDARIVGERIASGLERFGSNRFKGIMHKTMSDVLDSGAIGVEIRLSGKLPGSRAKSWRVYGGYLKKCGDAALTHVRRAVVTARLKSGVIGIQVRILPGGVIMPDVIRLIDKEEKKETDNKEEGKKEDESKEEGKKEDESKEEGKKDANKEKKEEKKDSEKKKGKEEKIKVTKDAPKSNEKKTEAMEASPKKADKSEEK